MKRIETGGISYIRPVSGAAGEWYYGTDNVTCDLYEAEELFRKGAKTEGRKLILIHYPDGAVFTPLKKKEGRFIDYPNYCEGSIYMIDADLYEGVIRIVRFDSTDHQTEIYAELPLSAVKDLYNLRLDIAPLTLSRQNADKNEFELLWPEKVSFRMGDRESFFLRDGDRLFFNKWYEEGEGEEYRFWEETVIRNLNGEVIDTIPGDVMLMPNGEIWHLN